MLPDVAPLVAALHVAHVHDVVTDQRAAREDAAVQQVALKEVGKEDLQRPDHLG